MKLRKLITLIIISCAALLAHDKLGVCQHCSDEPTVIKALCETAYNDATIDSSCSATQFTSPIENHAFSLPRTIGVPNFRSNCAKRNTNNTNIQDRTAQNVRELTKRYFTKTTDCPAYFQTGCYTPADYLISIGILVI